ncbi:MAG: Slp family lipoprotein [Deltaproteobacteria bacterium]|nr:Slp family lipoprotein [Deltaproteobacteria bacterium]
MKEHGPLRKTLLVIALLALAGCGPVLSKETLGQVDRGLQFEEVIKDPSAHTGSSVVLGGTILGIENLRDRTIIEVLEQDMNSQLRPIDPEKSAGRFLVEFDGFRDPAIFSRGKLLTVAGRITGAQERPLGKGTYAYPVIKPIEHYLWEERGYSGEPRIGIGVGIGITHID